MNFRTVVTLINGFKSILINFIDNLIMRNESLETILVNRNSESIFKIPGNSDFLLILENS